MPRFKPYSYNQMKLIPVQFKDQVLPGTFEYALNYIVDNELDLKIFEPRFANNITGAPAFDPAILLKIILYAYSRGITSSRRIAQCCENNIIFKALSCDTMPHFTTIANFITTMEKEISSLFRDVLLICTEMNLIGKTMFAIDGCKMPSNASKEWSGTTKDFQKKKEKIEKTIEYIMNKHRTNDGNEQLSVTMKQEEIKHVENLQKKAKKIQDWLKKNEEKIGKGGKPIKSNITDNESAKMKTSHGVIQGYNGVAAVDSKHQIIVHAEAFGAGQEHELLKPIIEGTQENFKAIEKTEEIFKEADITADSGFHTENNLKMLSEKGISAYIPDNKFRKRDSRFVTAERHKKEKKYQPKYFTAREFQYNKETGKAICPAGKELWLKCKNNVTSNGFTGAAYMGRVADCKACGKRTKCLRNPETTLARQVVFLDGGRKVQEESFTKKMIKKIETIKGRFIYSKRMGTVEPVFANIRHTIGLDRFSLRSKIKVNTQWLLYCIIHNLKKIHTFSPQMAY